MSKASNFTGFVLMILVAACVAPPSTASVVKVPDRLQPGVNESLAMIVPAKGVQIYECRAREDQAGGYEWAFVAPEAARCPTRGRPCDCGGFQGYCMTKVA